MNVIRGDGKLLQEIDLAPENEYREILQNVAVILDLVQKSCPMFRDGGLPGEVIGRPLPVAENMLIANIYDQIEEFEPRAVIAAVTFEQDPLSGKVIPIVELKGGEED